MLTEWGSAVYVQRQGDAAWEERGGWSERMLNQTYGSGYVHTLVMRLERGKAGGPVPGHTLGALHHVYAISGRLRTGPSMTRSSWRPATSPGFPATSRTSTSA
ncbi:hypothetical protein GCM10009734_94800 [Nonomuraea bangladeshensis]